MTQPSPSLTARVVMPAGSPPAPGSEMAMEERIRPRIGVEVALPRLVRHRLQHVQVRAVGREQEGRDGAAHLLLDRHRAASGRSAPPNSSGTSRPHNPRSFDTVRSRCFCSAVSSG